MGHEGVEAVGRPAVSIHGELLAESLLFPPVGEPVVNTHLGDQVGAQAVGLRRRHASLKALSPGRTQNIL